MKWLRQSRQHEAPRVHQPEEWKKRFRDFGDGTSNPDMNGIRGMRADVWFQTEECVRNGGYNLPDGKWVDLRVSDPARTQKIKVGAPSLSSKNICDNGGGRASESGLQNQGVECPNSSPCQVIVQQMDCLDLAQHCFREGFRVAVLNMANAFTPGGGFKSGAGAQEETLHRRSDLSRFLYDQGKKFYPLKGDCALLSEGVVVFRGAEKDGYPLLQEPFDICVISCAALSKPDLVWNHRDPSAEPQLTDESEVQTRTRVEAILSAARSSNCSVIVLSAFGCGAFGNPPRHVAQIFKDVLTTEYLSEFQYIVFSIIDDHNAGRPHNPNGNVAPFQEVFADLARSETHA